MEHLKKKIYGNIKVLSPDGEPMFLCGDEKANWYLSRGLAKVISDNEDGKVIQLTFKPKGMGHSSDVNKNFFLSKKEAKCVVCGSEKELTKHHCVPYFFRSIWSKIEEEKKHVNHTMHDVLIICIDCHRKYEKEASKFKDNLIKDIIIQYQKDHMVADRFVCAIKNINIISKRKISSKQRKSIHKFLSSYVDKNVENMTAEEIKNVIEELKKERKRYKQIAKENMKENLRIYMKKDSLKNFFIMWRKHFIDIMNPQYMPKNWDINYWRE